MATAYAYREADIEGRAAGPGPAKADTTNLEKIHDTLDIPGCRIEILEGRIVVNPSPINRHGLLVTWLADALADVCREHGWERNAHSTVDLPATGERVEPDLLVYKVDERAMDEWLVPARDTVLVVEVVSPSSWRDDYEVKRRGCGLSGVPIYLIVDPEARNLTVFSEPGERGYLSAAPVSVGGKLALPEPIDVTLDTSTMPIRRDR